MKILGIDIGYGDVKVVYINDGNELSKKFKFNSLIGITKRNEFIKDNKIYTFKGHDYYVGEDASSLASESLTDITDYKNLEYYAPLFLAHAIRIIGEEPDVIVTGLSKAQIKFSGYFKNALIDFEVDDKHYTFKNVYVIPQGAGSKLCIDKYGCDFPNVQTEFTGKTSYIGVDIGFNTLDLFRVIDGKTSASVFDGIEHEGIMKIASKVAKLIKDKHDRPITLHEAKDILNTNTYRLRGTSYNYSQEIKDIKKEYIKDLLSLIEEKYGAILDKCDYVFLSGGGSAFFNSAEYMGNKILVPKSNYEYYNAIGQAMFGQEMIRKESKNA